MGRSVVAFSTAGTAEDAERIAHALVERRVAACVNVVANVVSVYRWKDAIQRDEERLLVIKTTRDRVAALKTVLASVHPYEVPELIVLPVDGGLAPYLACVGASVAAPRRAPTPRPRAAARKPPRPR